MTTNPSMSADAASQDDAVDQGTTRAVTAALTDTKVLRQIGIAVIAVVVALKFLFWLFDGTRHFLFLLLLAWLFAIAMEPAVGWFARRNMRRGYATGIVLLSLFSAIVGFAVIHFLLGYLRTRSLVPFVIYRYGVAVLTLVIAAIRVS